MSEGWSVSQKEAIRERVDVLMQEHGIRFHEDYEAIRAARPAGETVLDVLDRMETKSRKEFITQLFEVLEAITKGSEQ